MCKVAMLYRRYAYHHLYRSLTSETYLDTTVFKSTLGALVGVCVNELSIAIKYRKGLLNIVADMLSHCPKCEQLFLSDEDTVLFTKYLKHIAPQLTWKQCVNAAITAM